MKTLCLILFASISTISYGQTLEELVQNVPMKKTTKNQSLSYVEGSECLVQFTIYDTDDKEEIVFELNLADLNENTVSFDTKGSEVRVEASTRGKRDLVKVYEDGDVEGFDDEMYIFAAGIEEAREIVYALKEAVEACTKNLTNSDYSESSETELLAQLENNIGDITVEGDKFLQSLNKAPLQQDVLVYELTDEDEGEVKEYFFNPADLDEGEVAFDTDDTSVILKLETNGRDDLIKVVENGQVDEYTNEIEILMQNLEQARDMVYLWQEYIQRFENETVAFIDGTKDASLEQTLTFIPENIGEVAVNDDIFQQELSIQENESSGFGFILNYEVEEVSEKEINTYRWNMADVNPNEIRFDIDKTLVQVVLPIDDGRNLIQRWENGEMEGFEDEVSIYVNTLEDAKRMVNAFRHFAGIIIQGETTFTLPESAEGLATYLQEIVQEVVVDDDRYQQSFESREGNPCLGLFELTDDDDEMVYEWNFADLDLGDIDFDTKGDDILIKVETSGGRDLIEVRENGEVDDFENEFEIRASSIEEARAIVEAIKQLTKSCKGD
jgi:hypothetical protein